MSVVPCYTFCFYIDVNVNMTFHEDEVQNNKVLCRISLTIKNLVLVTSSLSSSINNLHSSCVKISITKSQIMS